VDYARVEELTDGEAQCRAIDSLQPTEGVSRFQATDPEPEEPWSFEPLSLATFKANVAESASALFGEIAQRMYQGIRTSMNPVYVLETVNAKKGLYRSKYLSQTIELEADLLRPFL